MDDTFFGFKTDFSSKSREKSEDLLTDNEEEYDALNDETFGIGADDGDWEEDHDKFAGLKDQSLISARSTFFDSSLYDGDDSQNEIVSQSISQLGLEDDLDDPAIMTIGRRAQNIWCNTLQRSSPPPPAIIDPELCGSPKTHSIWSTNNTSTPAKDSGIGSLFSSINSSASSYQKHRVSPMSPIPCNVFASPLAAKTWTLEEIERDLTSKPASSCWSGVPSNLSEQNSFQAAKLVGIPENRLHDPFSSARVDSTVTKTVPGIRTLDDVETDLLRKSQAPTVEEVERLMKAKATPEPEVKPPIIWPAAVRNAPIKPLVWPYNNIRPGFQPPISPAQVNLRPGAPFAPFAPPVITGDKATNFAGAFRPNFKPMPVYPSNMNPLNNVAFGKGQMGRKNPVFFPTSVLNSQNMKGLMFGPGRLVRHPLLGADYIWRYPTPNHPPYPEGDFRRAMMPENYDEYSGLMMQWEKKWLLQIQLMLVQTDNPYVEDFYYSTFLARKCAQEALKKKPDKKDGPKLLLPERAKTETKAYVPAQFEGSLGKLQAVSVNFPRKVLDITVSRSLEDDEGHPVTNQSVTKNRRLLINIENLYRYLLEIDDEEKRILALPEDAHGAHLDNIERLTEKLFVGLCCETAMTNETFHNIMMVRKGRSLGMRSFGLLSNSQKCSFLIALCRCLSHVLRKDQNDLILLKNIDQILACIKTLCLNDIVTLGQSLENLPRTDTVIVPIREKSNFISAFKNKFGTSLVCCIVERAEAIYSGIETPDSEDQAKWAKVILHIVDILCTLPDTSIVPPSASPDDLLIHFQRFAVDRDKFEVLKKKLNLFQLNSISNTAL